MDHEEWERLLSKVWAGAQDMDEPFKLDQLAQDVPILGDEPGTCLDNDHCKPQWDDAQQILLDIERRILMQQNGLLDINAIRNSLGLGDAPNSDSD